MKPFEDAPKASSSPLIIGHRGAAAVAPENTLVSFERAIKEGAHGIEFDVRLARDLVPVVIHDPSLRRTALREGAISTLTSDELREVNVGAWFNHSFPALAREEYARATIPTLAEVFELFTTGDAILYVEMKCAPTEASAIAAEVVNLVREYGLSRRVVVESFMLSAVAEIKRIDPSIRTAALFEPKLVPPSPSMRRIFAEAAECRADELALHRLLATRRTTTEAKRRGLSVAVWTVDKPSWLQRARDYGVHAIITNNPALMVSHG